MSIEVTLTQLIGAINGNRIWWDDLPDGYVIDQPVVIGQQVGGDPYQWVENEATDEMHARIRLTVWAKSRLTANALARQLEAMLVESGLKVQVYGAFNSLYDADMGYYGTSQDFGFWYPRP